MDDRCRRFQVRSVKAHHVSGDTDTHSHSATVDQDWSFDIKMSEISAVDATAPGLVPGGISTTIQNINIPDPVLGTENSWGVQSAPDGAKDAVSDAVKSIDFQGISNAIQAGLSGAGHFVLPGNGTFKMTRPRLNANGDFLCHLEYLPTSLGGTSDAASSSDE